MRARVLFSALCVAAVALTLGLLFNQHSVRSSRVRVGPHLESTTDPADPSISREISRQSARSLDSETQESAGASFEVICAYGNSAHRRPLPDATVRLLQQPSGGVEVELQEESTNSDGSCILRNICVGEYSIMVKSPLGGHKIEWRVRDADVLNFQNTGIPQRIPISIVTKPLDVQVVVQFSIPPDAGELRVYFSPRPDCDAFPSTTRQPVIVVHPRQDDPLVYEGQGSLPAMQELHWTVVSFPEQVPLGSGAFGGDLTPGTSRELYIDLRGVALPQVAYLSFVLESLGSSRVHEIGILLFARDGLLLSESYRRVQAEGAVHRVFLPKRSAEVLFYTPEFAGVQIATSELSLDISKPTVVALEPSAILLVPESEFHDRPLTAKALVGLPGMAWLGIASVTKSQTSQGMVQIQGGFGPAIRHLVLNESVYDLSFEPGAVFKLEQSWRTPTGNAPWVHTLLMIDCIEPPTAPITVAALYADLPVFVQGISGAYGRRRFEVTILTPAMPLMLKVGSHDTGLSTHRIDGTGVPVMIVLDG